MLSHADDDHLVLTDPRVASIVAGAFHLLFTEPTTHPDQVAQWMRATRFVLRIGSMCSKSKTWRLRGCPNCSGGSASL